MSRTMMRTPGLACLCIGIALALAACAQRQATFLPNGQRVSHITCNLAPQGAVACYRSAGALCGPRGYVLYDWNGRPWREPYPSPAALDTDPDFPTTGLLVACKR
jgi:hypothetical protein